MKNYNHWFIKVLFITILSFVPVGIINYMIDPFGGTSYIVEKKFKPIVEERKQKYNYIFTQNNYGKFETVVFGSSRVMCLRPGGNSYNFGVSGASLPEIAFLVNQWMSMDKKPKNIILGIDFLSFSRVQKDQTTEFIKNEFQRGNSFASYLFSLDTLKLSYKCYDYSIKNSPVTYFRDDGSIFYAEYENEIINGTFNQQDKRMISEAKERYAYHNEFTYADTILDYLREIKNLCDKNNVTLIPFLTPENKFLHLMLMDDTKLKKHYFRMRKDLLLVFDSYYDFAGLNSINNNNLNYYDAWHYRPVVGDLMLAKLFGLKKNVPLDFGVLVTKQNISARLNQLNEETAN